MNFKTVYTIVVFISLAGFEYIIIGLFPPLFQYIANDLHTNMANFGYLSAVNILSTAISSLFWGYGAGKYNRKRLILSGTLIWVISLLFTAFSNSFWELALYQIITGIGLGCMASIGFSVLTDYIPYQKRGLILSLWGMAQGLGAILGSVFASLTASSTNWRWPFILVGIIGLLLMALFLFVEEPVRGRTELQGMEAGQAYEYTIEVDQIKKLLLKKSNLNLCLQAFFMNIATGSLIWIPTLFVYKIIEQGYSMGTAVITAGYLYAIFQIGGMASAYLGNIGDKWQKKTLKGRAYITAFFVFVSTPLYILFFSLPLKNLSLPAAQQPVWILFSIIKQIVVNPSITVIFVLSLLTYAAQSANTPNWLALLTDVNLPEHRGTAFSVANLFNSLGRTAGNLGVGILLGLISAKYREPVSYILTLSLLQLFRIPSSWYYIKMSKHNVVDILQVRRTLLERAKS